MKTRFQMWVQGSGFTVSGFYIARENSNYQSQLQNLRKRPEGPELNRPDRKVGIRLRLAISAGAA
jgi:hypothetical protein